MAITMSPFLPTVLLLALFHSAAAARHLHAASAAADASCGAAGSPGGASLKSSCHPSGQYGYYQPGFFCGWTFSDTSRKTVCMRVPKDCGTPGRSCCPGNAATVITDPDATPKPTCSSDSYCFFTPTPDASGWSAPPFASPAGPLLGTCRTVDLSCGTSLGKSCCPSTYHTAVNPPLPPSISQVPGICGGTLFCNTTTTTDAFGSYWPQGTCIANKPDCGAYGKSCCISTSGAATSTQCGPEEGVGYCVYAGGKATGDMRDMVCTQCPAVDVVAATPSKYY